ncbi:MAG: hypothetical protein ABJN65_13695 [Parasphingorhabdus sp.]
MVGKPVFLPVLAIMMLLFAQCAPASTTEQKTSDKTPVSIKLMTSLPIIWGEGDTMQDIISGNTEFAPIYRYWLDRYAIEGVDSLEGLTGGTTDIVMLVQPRAMDPADLAELDDWVRKGGDAIIMTDPDLVWPSALPLGDPKRPLSGGLLSPLLKHWGLELVSQDNVADLIELEFADHKISTVGIGGFETLGNETAENVVCNFSEAGFIAQCQIDRGRVILVADADFLHEQFWEIDADWEDGAQSGAMLLTDALIDQFYNVSKD